MSDAVFTDFDQYFGSGAKASETVAESKGKERDVKLIILKVIVFALGFFLLAEGLLYALVIPCFGTPAVTFSGVEITSRASLQTALEPMKKASWMAFDAERAVGLLSSVSSVESVAVDKQFPDRVNVRITERTPVAKSIISINGCSKSVQIDKNGVIFSVHSDDVLQDNTIPLVSGIPLDSVSEGMRLPAKYRVLMDQIAAIRSLPQKYFAAVSEIQVVPKEYGNYELVLYPAQAKVRVLTDRSLDEDSLKHMMVVLDVVPSIEPNVTEIDLRYGSLSYRVGADRSGASFF